MIGYMKKIHRFYNTKTKKITSSKDAFDWALDHHMHHVPVINTKKHKHAKKRTKRVAKKAKRQVHNRPSYKKLYRDELKRNKHAELQLQKLENQCDVGKFHPFIVNKTKQHEVTPESNYKDVIDWSHNHGGKLFVVAALGNDDQSIVKACGSVHKNEVAGFGATELLPQLNEIFSDGYND